jgi:hypothetical protein
MNGGNTKEEFQQETKEKHLLSRQRIETKLKQRKLELNKKLWSKRRESSNKDLDIQMLEPEEEKEVPMNPKDGYLPLHLHQKHYLKKKKKYKRCWKCKAFWHLKENCPKMRCWYCGHQGHTKRKCFKYELHMAIKALKRAQNQIEEKPIKKQQKIKDRFKMMEFRKEKEDIIMSCKGMDLALYIGNSKWEWAKRGFEKPRIPSWKMERPIKTPVSCRQLKLSDYLPHQCGSCGEVIDGHAFITHCDTKHGGYCPEGLLINASPYRFWLLWYDDRNWLRFNDMSKEPQFIKADPPWI